MSTYHQDLQQQEAAIIEQMVHNGASPEEIDAQIQKMYDQNKQLVYEDQPRMSDEEVASILESLANYDSTAVFKQKPEKPGFFKSPKSMRKFRKAFDLKSDRKYTLNGEENYVKKLNLRDVMHLSTKIPEYARYIGFNTPKMLVDEITGEYRLTETILTLLERAFSDWDEQNDRPTDFAHSVLEEIAYFLNIRGEDDIAKVDYLLSCDPEEVFEAVRLVVEYNQGFFTKAWNALGPIKEIWSLISGTITSKIKNLKLMQDLQKEEMNQNQTPE